MLPNGRVNEWKLKQQICEIGQRVYQRGFAAANDGNISVRVGPNRVLCSPTMICKGFMTPDDICTVDLEGNQLAGRRKRTSEILLHLAIMKARDDVQSVVHCHPPHATAFAVAHETIPMCVLPEVEVFLGEVPIARYETPGTQEFAETVLPFVHKANTIILANHGTVSFGSDVEDAYWKTEILDAYCRILLLARQLGPIQFFSSEKTRELLNLKERLGISDPRLECENCDLCGNAIFGRGYVEPSGTGVSPVESGGTGVLPVPDSQSDSHSATGNMQGPPNGASSNAQGQTQEDLEGIVQAVTDRVFAALSQST